MALYRSHRLWGALRAVGLVQDHALELGLEPAQHRAHQSVSSCMQAVSLARHVAACSLWLAHTAWHPPPAMHVHHSLICSKMQQPACHRAVLHLSQPIMPAAETATDAPQPTAMHARHQHCRTHWPKEHAPLHSTSQTHHITYPFSVTPCSPRQHSQHVHATQTKQGTRTADRPGHSPLDGVLLGHLVLHAHPGLAAPAAGHPVAGALQHHVEVHAWTAGGRAVQGQCYVR